MIKQANILLSTLLLLFAIVQGWTTDERADSFQKLHQQHRQNVTYEIKNFDYDDILDESHYNFPFRFFFLDDGSAKADHMNRLYKYAVGQLSKRDIQERDTERNATFWHLDVKDEDQKQYLTEILKEEDDPSNYPDVLLVTQSRQVLFKYKIDPDQDDDDNGDFLMWLMDQETSGSFKVVTCKKLKQHLKNDKKRIMIFYGDKKLIQREGVYSHFTDLAQLNRQFMRGDEEGLQFFRVRDFECVNAQDPEKLGINYVMLFTTNNENQGAVLWLDDFVAEADTAAKNLDALQQWVDVKMTEEDMAYNLRSFSALNNLHMGIGSMLLYMPKESQVDTSDDWVAEQMRELNEENIRNQDLSMLLVNTTYEKASLKDSYPHLAPWLQYKDLNYQTATSNLFLLTNYHKKVHTFPFDLNDKSQEAEFKEKFQNNDLIYTWARYWQLTDMMDILQSFEDNDERQNMVLFSDILRDKEIKPEIKILSKILKTAGFVLRKDNKILTKKVNKSKKQMPDERDVEKVYEDFGTEMELRRLARLARRERGEKIVPDSTNKNYVEEVESSESEHDEPVGIVNLDEEEEVLAPSRKSIEELTQTTAKDQHQKAVDQRAKQQETKQENVKNVEL